MIDIIYEHSVISPLWFAKRINHVCVKFLEFTIILEISDT